MRLVSTIGAAFTGLEAPARLASADPAAREVERVAEPCNLKLDQCRPPLGATGPCLRDEECASGICVDQSCA
jgi:hypothetical protein